MLINREGGWQWRRCGERVGGDGGGGAADAAVPPGVRKRGMMDTADHSERKFSGKEEEAPSSGH